MGNAVWHPGQRGGLEIQQIEHQPAFGNKFSRVTSQSSRPITKIEIIEA